MTNKTFFVGDSWALKAWSKEDEYTTPEPRPDDVRLADFWDIEYTLISCPGKGNLEITKKLVVQSKPGDKIIWIFTEPLRDYANYINDNDQFGWMHNEDYQNIRNILAHKIFQTITELLPDRKIGFIGGLSDIEFTWINSVNFTLLHNSWQKWISQQVEFSYFIKGWGASDVGMRIHTDNVKPTKKVLFDAEEHIREMCHWEENGYFVCEHPSIKAVKEFALFLKPKVESWIKENETK